MQVCLPLYPHLLLNPLALTPSKRPFPRPQAKLANFHALRLSRGLHFNDSLHASKAFRNPRIYAKLVEFVDVDETGTNWARGVWDPKGLPADATAARIGALACFPVPAHSQRN